MEGDPDDNQLDDRVALRHEVERLKRLLERRTRSLRLARAALRQGRSIDPLTGLPLRGRAEAWLRKAGACLMADLDGFKRVNDEHGHLEGDRILREVARSLAQALPSAARIARYGGDEFLIVLPRSIAAEARDVAEKLRGSLANCLDLEPLSLTIGLALARTGESAESLLTRADKALLRAKKAGGDRVEIDGT